MPEFLDANFLLDTPTAQTLYHTYAAELPIYDYHCHIPPAEIAANRQFTNLTELWLGGDHYKWRAMRSNGIPERYITGAASDFEKFTAWAETLPKCIGNPLYHWSHLELQRYFGIKKRLDASSAAEIWEQCNAQLRQPGFTVQSLIQRSNVAVLVTTEEPLDNLEYHRRIRQDAGFTVKVSTAFRPDAALEVAKSDFPAWVGQLEKVSGLAVGDSYQRFLEALEARVRYFHQMGCRLSDHALDEVTYAREVPGGTAAIFKKRISGEPLNAIEAAIFKTETLLFLGRLYKQLDWAMQLHIGAMRFNNSRMQNVFGYDSIGDAPFAKPLALLLDALDQQDELPRTILYCLNPSDNEVIGTMIGNFQDGLSPGKIQFGSGWWFNDTEDGINRQLQALANLGLLSRFVGMLTDSRSFISYPRHEYFRRILCNLLGGWADSGRLPRDLNLLGATVQDICFYNAERYFGL